MKNPYDILRMKEQELIRKHSKDADVIITTALIPGKRSPILITEEMVKEMKPGSVIMDLAVEQGGNCVLSEAGKEVVKQVLEGLVKYTHDHFFHEEILLFKHDYPDYVRTEDAKLVSKNTYDLAEYLVKLNAEGKLDLNQYLVKHPAATFFVRVTGDSMIGAGIHSSDLLIVDRSLEPKDKNVVIASVDGELTVKRLSMREGKPALLPDNDQYAPVEVGEHAAFEVWGVVTNVIHSL
jgi:DNA polymerase V